MKTKLYLLKAQNDQLREQLAAFNATDNSDDLKRASQDLFDFGGTIKYRQSEWDRVLDDIKKHVGEARTFAKVVAVPIKPNDIPSKTSESVLLAKP
ncbi:hypothetical protein HNY73_020082 [Argiope bruennichi]|uniref:Uncharacterized protein n=1 Tax=Argiope bruennichi TaxID=94029 RepID=A0A8T0EA35_ARGBR|nr:hypothetical protein HNY73_020082 [Argiope bruennichi]